MKYLFTVVFGSIAVCLSLITGWSMHLALVDAWQWWLVALGILLPTVVSVLITTAAYCAARDY